MKWLQFAAIATLILWVLIRWLPLGGENIDTSITPPKEIVNAKDNSTMILIPAGEFLMGSTEAAILACESEAEKLRARRWFTDEAPQHTAYLNAYYIDKYEVTNAQYRKFVQETDHRPPRYWGRRFFDRPDLPVVGVSWYDAVAYAQWAGKRLPTESEWEKAARGTDGRFYPWGDVFDLAKCNAYFRRSIGTQPVGSYLQGKSPYGLFDMAGNAWEWCSDWYSSDYYAQSPDSNPQGPETGEEKVMRGGSWWVRMPTGETRCTYRGANAPTERHDNYGFRLVKDIEEGFIGK